MPTTLPTTSPFATLTARQVMALQAELMARYLREDQDRAERLARILAL